MSGPVTPEGKRKVSLNAITHGGFRYIGQGLYPPCRKCIWREERDLFQEDATCRLFEALEQERFQAIMRMSHIRPEDGPLVQLYVRNLTFISMVDLWLSKVSPFVDQRGSLDTQGVLKMRWVSENASVRQAADLGLTRASRKNLNLPFDTLTNGNVLVIGGSKEQYIQALRWLRQGTAQAEGRRTSEGPPVDWQAQGPRRP